MTRLFMGANFLGPFRNMENSFLEVFGYVFGREVFLNFVKCTAGYEILVP